MLFKFFTSWTNQAQPMKKLKKKYSNQFSMLLKIISWINP